MLEINELYKLKLDVQRKNVVINVDMSSLGHHDKMARKKLTHGTTQKDVQHHDATDI